MSDNTLAHWNLAVEAALREESDFDETWEGLQSAIEAAPTNAALLRLALRLADAAGLRREQLSLYTRLTLIDPTDWSAWKDRALLQLRWTFLLVDDELDEEAAAAATDALETEALEWLVRAAKARRQDPDFSAALFADWRERNVQRSWLRLRLVLEALAAAPQHAGLRRELALCWEDLAGQTPEGFEDGHPLPVGFLVDPFGMLWDPFMLERGLAAVETLLASAPDDVDLHRQHARLQQALFRYPQASAAYLRLAAACDIQAQRATDEAQRDDWHEQAEAARSQAALCEGGSQALVASSLQAMEQAVSRLGQPMSDRADPANEALQAMLADWEASMRDTQAQLQDQLAGLEEQRQQRAAGPDEEQRAQLDLVAAQIAAQVVASLQLEPLRCQVITPEQFQQDWAAQLQPVSAALAALGWQWLGWCELPQFEAQIGHQAVIGLWLDPARTTAALGFVVKGQIGIDFESQLESGRLLVTSASRGKNFLTGGPDVDTLFVEPRLPLAEVAHLHAARLRFAKAEAPGGAALTLRASDDIIAMQERGRQLKLRFRLAIGLTEFEALAVPCEFGEYLSARLREEVAAGMAALRQVVPG